MLYQKPQALKQGKKGVDEYHKEMVVVMIKPNIKEDREVIMAKFISGLNQEITM